MDQHATKDDVMISILPLGHMFQRVADVSKWYNFTENGSFANWKADVALKWEHERKMKQAEKVALHLTLTFIVNYNVIYILYGIHNAAVVQVCQHKWLERAHEKSAIREKARSRARCVEMSLILEPWTQLPLIVTIFPHRRVCFAKEAPSPTTRVTYSSWLRKFKSYAPTLCSVSAQGLKGQCTISMH